MTPTQPSELAKRMADKLTYAHGDIFLDDDCCWVSEKAAIGALSETIELAPLLDELQTAKAQLHEKDRVLRHITNMRFTSDNRVNDMNMTTAKKLAGQALTSNGTAVKGLVEALQKIVDQDFSKEDMASDYLSEVCVAYKALANFNGDSPSSNQETPQ